MSYDRFTKLRKKKSIQVDDLENIHRLVDILPEVVFEVSLDGRLLFSNQKGYEISGRTEEEVENLFITDMLVPEDRERAAENIAKVLKGDEAVPNDYTVLKPDGERIPICIKSIPNYVNGELVSFLGILIDNRHRIESERKLRESEQKFRGLVEQSPDLIIRFNSRLEIEYLNPAMEALSELEFEDIIGKRLSDIGVSEKSVKQLEKSLEKVFHTGNPCQFIWNSEVLEKYYDIKLIPEKNENEKTLSVLSIARDITNIRLSEQKRIESEEHYRQLFTTMLDSFALHEIICDNDGKPVDYVYLEVNPAFERMIDNDAHCIVGKRVSEVFPESYKQWVEMYGDVALTGESIKMDHFCEDLGKHLDIIAYRPRENQFALIVRDITEKKRLEYNLTHTVKMEAIGQLAGGIAHDFNNVLMGILGYANMLKDQPENVEFVKKAAETIERSGQRASGLIKNLLGFARKGKNQVIAVNIHSLVDEVIDLVSRLIEKKVKVQKFFEAERSMVLCDPAQIQQVILNLLLNARDAMPDGGEIQIRTKEIYLSKKVCPHDDELGEGWYIEVSTTDTGEGIPEEIIEKVFEPFFTTKGKGQGSGMGLAMAYGVIKNHGGLIKVESQKGIGATVKFALRLMDRDDGKVPLSVGNTSDSSIVTKKFSVLVVDDEEASLRASKMLFEKTGCVVDTAKNGKTALELFEPDSEKYDLVIVDMEMPVMQGDELYDRLKEIKPDVQVIILSRYSIDEKSQSVLNRGARGFIHKPFRIEDIERVVSRLAEK